MKLVRNPPLPVIMTGSVNYTFLSAVSRHQHQRWMQNATSFLYLAVVWNIVTGMVISSFLPDVLHNSPELQEK